MTRRVAIIRFPGSNCERETAAAVRDAVGADAVMVEADAATLGDVDAVILPGGFSWGDYLRSGAMAARAPIMEAVTAAAAARMPVIGICNGFQILCEAGLLPGALIRNTSSRFVSRDVRLVPAATIAAAHWTVPGATITIPVAHAEGRYVADAATMEALASEGRIVVTYAPDDNPNGSLSNIAGVCSEHGNVVGLMPHPERAIDPRLGGTDGRDFFYALARSIREGVLASVN